MAEIQNPFDVVAPVMTSEEKARIFNNMFKDRPYGTPFYL